MWLETELEPQYTEDLRPLRDDGVSDTRCPSLRALFRLLSDNDCSQILVLGLSLRSFRLKHH